MESKLGNREEETIREGQILMATLLREGFLEEVRDPRTSALYSPEKSALDKMKPIDYIMNIISKNKSSTSAANRIFLIDASTGSGKSAIIPPEFFHQFFNEMGGRSICCTQPRVLTAIEIPNMIATFHTKESLQKTGHPSRTPLIMGKNLGYQTGPIAKKPVRGLIYMTIGVLTQQINMMTDEDFMNKYSAIFIDEVHERSVGTDYVLYALKKFVQRNSKHRNCPFVFIMSATFDVWKFCDYLLESVPAPGRYKNIIKARGSTHNIEHTYLSYDATNYLQSVIDIVIEIHKRVEDFGGTARRNGEREKTGKKGERDGERGERKGRRGEREGRRGEREGKKRGKKRKYKLGGDESGKKHRDILIFVSGASDIRKLKKKLNQLNSHDSFFQNNPILPVELTSSIVERKAQQLQTLFGDLDKLQVEVLVGGERVKGEGVKGEVVKGEGVKGGGIQLRKPKRRVFIATNVAETGLTIHTLRYVIETGWFKSSEFDPNFAVHSLVTKPVTRSMSTQRGGRAGRESDGFVYYMYTKETLDQMQGDQFPDIVKNEISLDLLSLIVAEADPNKTGEVTNETIDIANLDLLDLPPADGLHCALEKLFVLGAVDESSVPTKLGFLMNRFRFITAESIRVILAGYAWGACIIDLINMIAMVETGLDRVFPEELRKAYTAWTGDLSRVLFVAADDFIQAAIFFRAFQDHIAELDISDATNLQRWAEERGASIAALNDVIELRENVINSLALVGLDPYIGFEGTGFEGTGFEGTGLEDINSIKIIKRCLFEGFKLNIAVWNSSDKKYHSRKSHLPIQVTSSIIRSEADIAKYGDTNPKYILYFELACLPKGLIYSIEAKVISVLDGFVPMDVNYDIL